MKVHNVRNDCIQKMTIVRHDDQRPFERRGQVPLQPQDCFEISEKKENNTETPVYEWETSEFAEKKIDPTLGDMTQNVTFANAGRHG